MTCKRIAKLLSERQDHELSFSRRLAIRVHLTWCVFCRRLAKHLVIMRGLSKAVGEASAVVETGVLDAALTPDAKDRLKKLLASRNP